MARVCEGRRVFCPYGLHPPRARTAKAAVTIAKQARTALRHDAGRFLKSETARMGVSLEPADVLLRRAEGVPEAYIMAADELLRHLASGADPLSNDSGLVVLAHAGALALLGKIELDMSS
jgi:hypothetical protein